MHFLKVVAFTAASALAIPLATIDARSLIHQHAGPHDMIELHHMSCYADMSGINRLDYQVKIGEPYDEGSGCAHIQDILDDQIAVHDWKCESDTHNGTVLTFHTGYGQGAKINTQLNLAYAVAWPYDFNCPSH